MVSTPLMQSELGLLYTCMIPEQRGCAEEERKPHFIPKDCSIGFVLKVQCVKYGLIYNFYIGKKFNMQPVNK